MKLKPEHIAEQWVDDDGYWIALKPGFKSDDDPIGNLHTIHEDNKLACYFHGVMPCECKDCLKP